MSPIDAQRVWLERIMASKVVGFSVLDENGTLVQCIDDDPDLRLALMEYQTQRIRELERSQRTSAPVTYPLAGEYLTVDGAGGQAADDAAFGDFARRASHLGDSRGIPLT